jgi:hypothetical protein
VTLEELQAQFWSDADDVAEPHIFDAADVTVWLNEAEDEACMRADLIEEADDSDFCEITVVPSTTSYALHAKLLRVTYLAHLATDATERTEIAIRQRNEVDRIRADWRTVEQDPPDLAMVTGQKLRLASVPTVAGTILLECTRLPLEPMADDADEPEIPALHHRGLIQWALYRAYSKPDTETRDPGRAAGALAIFERLFGLRTDSDMRRASEAGDQFNKAW